MLNAGTAEAKVSGALPPWELPVLPETRASVRREDSVTAPGARGLLPVFLSLAGVAAGFCLEGVPAFDQAAQSLFYSENGWLLSHEFHNAYKLFLYTGPKIGIGLAAAGALAVWVCAVCHSRLRERLRVWRNPVLILLLSIMMIPLAAASLKAVTGVYGPVDLLPYGGAHPHVGLLPGLMFEERLAGGRSFPAGHASGGFALMALYYLPLSGKKRLVSLGFGLACGWLMGLYQMARGEHFLSHTLTSMFIALVVMTLLSRRFPPARSR